MNFDNIAKLVRDTGIAKVHNFLNEDEVARIKIAISNFLEKKTNPITHYSVKKSSLLIKLLKFDLEKFLSSIILLKISKQKKMKEIADLIFEEQSELTMIDAYKSPVSHAEVLPWHIDKAYDGAKVPYLPFHHPDSCSIKFFIYLTNVGHNNGCTSYIPGSHKITYALRKGLQEKKIKYSPHWKLHDLKNFINHIDNISYFKKYFNGTRILDQFMEDVKEENLNNYDFNMSPGDAIIFDEGGVHKGSKTLINERVVLRYLFFRKKFC